MQIFYPDDWLDSAYEIDYAWYYEKGYRGIIFDIDNTLVPHGAPADERSIELFRGLHELGYQTCLLSNNKEERVKPFADQVESKYIYKAGKPSVRNYKRAIRLMDTTLESTMFVGDQLFTDVWGANRTGIYTCLVKPIHPKEEIQIVLKRLLEKPFLYCYDRKRKKQRKMSK